MNKKFFAKLKSFDTILATDSFRKLMFLDYNDSWDLRDQLKNKIDFLCFHSQHWIEVEIETNEYWYCTVKGYNPVIIAEDWLSERRD